MKKLTVAFVFAALTLTVPAQAETVNCTAITTLPYTITTQGVYCFTGHLSTGITSGNAITINTNNVVLDLNGFKLGGWPRGWGQPPGASSPSSARTSPSGTARCAGFIWASGSLTARPSPPHKDM